MRSGVGTGACTTTSSTRNASSNVLEGGCACGEVRYRLTSEPLFTHCCHCLNCQRQTGNAFVINLLIEADRVELLRRRAAAGGRAPQRRQEAAGLPLPDLPGSQP